MATTDPFPATPRGRESDGASPELPDLPPGLQGAIGVPGRYADIAEAVRQALQQDVDAKVAEKMEEMTRKGRAMLLQVQQREQEKSDKLAAEIEACLARQQAMEAENAHLKQVIAGLASRLSMLGAAFGATAAAAAVAGPWAAGVGCAASPASTAAGNGPTLTPSPTRTASDLATPGPGADAAGLASLPEVPAFPFAAQPSQAGATLSLAEALCPQQSLKPPVGQQSEPTQLSLASSLPAGPGHEAAGAAAAGQAHEFSFTLRKADGADLGLSVVQNDEGRSLEIGAVRDDGAVAAWNRSCGARPERMVAVGDHIVRVNDVSESPERMLEECESKQLLRLTIRRYPPAAGDPAAAVAAAAAALGGWEGARPTSMRADASEFVPSVASAPPPAPAETPEDAPASA